MKRKILGRGCNPNRVKNRGRRETVNRGDRKRICHAERARRNTSTLSTKGAGRKKNSGRTRERQNDWKLPTRKRGRRTVLRGELKKREKVASKSVEKERKDEVRPSLPGHSS